VLLAIFANPMGLEEHAGRFSPPRRRRPEGRLSHRAFAPPDQRKHVQINRGAAEKSSTIDFSAKVGLARQHGDFVTSQSSRLSQGQQGRARHPVRAADSNPFAERRARSDAPYLT